jgi:hypothetical protein
MRAKENTMPDETQRAQDIQAGDAAESRTRQIEEEQQIEERDGLTPESRKQGVTSHLPVEETENMYRSEEDPQGDVVDGEDLPKIS